MPKNKKKYQNSVERQVGYLAAICKQLLDSNSFISGTEFAGMMHNILLGVRKLESLVVGIEQLQEKTLLEVVPFDIDKIKNDVSHIKVDIDESQSFDIEDKSKEDDTDWKGLIILENNEAPFTLGDNNTEYNEMRLYLLRNIKPHYYKIVEAIKNIKSHLSELKELTENIEGDINVRKDIYQKMFIKYQMEEWGQTYQSFFYQTKTAVEKGKEKGKTVEEVLESELGALTSQNYNTFMAPAINAIYKTVTTYKNEPSEVIFRNRAKLKEDDLSNYFSYLLRYRLLKDSIDAIPLKKPIEGKYAKLFTNGAAKEYVDLLSPLIKTHGGFDEKGHLGVCLLVMMDLGLANGDMKPYKQMMDYANEQLIDDDSLRFKEQSMITNTVRALRDIHFCEIAYGDNSKISLSKKELEAFQEVYWRCFTILNNFGIVKRKEKKIAFYLWTKHPNVRFEEYQSCLSVTAIRRLDFLRSVIRKETLDFD